MKIDRVVFCLNANPQFQGLWELNARLYATVWGIQPTLFCVANAAEYAALELSTEYGEVHRLERDVPGLPLRQPHRDSVTTLALLHGPQQFPDDEVIMTSGIDQFPLCPDFFELAEQTEEDILVGFAGCRDYEDHPIAFGCPYYPSSHIVMSSGNWRKVLGGDPDWGTDAPRMYHFGYPVMWPAYQCNWGVDEAFLSQKISISGLSVKRGTREWFDDWEARRINRPALAPIEATLAMTELHANRPISEFEVDFLEQFIKRNS